MGHYANWGYQSKLIPSNLHWYTVNNMIDYLHGVRQRVIEKRQRWYNLETLHAPLNRNTRFPFGTVYLCEGIGDWSMHFDLLHWSLYILDNETRLEKSGFDDIGQVETYAIDKINELFKSITKLDNLVTQERYEKMLELIWTEKKSWFVLLAWCDDKGMIPVMVTGLFERMDTLWNHVSANVNKAVF